MQFSTSTLLALVALVPSTLAHMYVSHPEVYMQKTDYKNFPLDASGSNYPCYETDGHSGNLPKYAPGSEQKFTIEGTAVHGGGSCQISITYDVPPRKDSPFYVLKSFQGDCPTQHAENLNSHGVFDLRYTIPNGIPGGKAVIAWSWFNRIGNREMYMRCAPVEIDSEVRGTAKLQELPAMWKAHIGAAGAPESCNMKEGDQFAFLEPGLPSAIYNSPGAVLKQLPESCRAYAGATPTKPETPKDEPTKPDTPKDEYKPEVPTAKPSAPSFIEIPKDKPDVANPPVAVPTKTNSPVATATVVPVKPDTGKPETPVKPVPSGGNCSEDGAIICTSASTWAVCDHGLVVPMGRVANGMVCRQGSMEFANSKREVRGMRFGHQHRRRHQHKRSGNL